ncbi:MAG: hypothetical protein D6675_07140 [Gemmatimonadetes bacterium]|nr:MAG: hypothetical protein D6675_07140 [Gemmatimonadota bacterium]
MKKGLIFTVLGATAGFLYYQYVGCLSGTCPITANPWFSTLYGALFGLILGWDSPKKRRESSQPHPEVNT